MIQKPIIILDFDRVLFDTEGYIDSLYESVKPFGVTRDIWHKAYVRREPEEAFNFKSLARQLASYTGKDAEDFIKAMKQETNDAVWYLFADARPFLEAVHKEAELHLLTFGARHEQELKIAATGIAGYFKGVIITDELKVLNQSLPISSVGRAIFINDSIKELMELGGMYRWSTHLHINRYGRELPADFPFPSFNGLADALPGVKGLMNTQTAGDATDGVANQRGYASE